MSISSRVAGNRRTLALVTLMMTAAVLTACARQPAPPSGDVPGFFSGLLHGFTMLFSLIGSIFFDWRIYAFPNSGWWYDLGYFFGASMFLGASGAGARRKTPTPPRRS